MSPCCRWLNGSYVVCTPSFIGISCREAFAKTMHIPLPEADTTTGRYIQPLDQAFVFGGAIRRALLTSSADTVTAYNGKFRYASVWSHLSNGEPFCIFAFDIYAFHYLSPPVENFPRVFVGSYVPKVIPQTAAWESAPKFDIARGEMLTRGDAASARRGQPSPELGRVAAGNCPLWVEGSHFDSLYLRSQWFDVLFAQPKHAVEPLFAPR